MLVFSGCGSHPSDRQLRFLHVIRTAWADARELRFGVGGGIVWDSDPADEYLETQHKAASLIGCLS
jgi:para-aminobenzoate synthetase component 1